MYTLEHILLTKFQPVAYLGGTFLVATQACQFSSTQFAVAWLHTTFVSVYIVQILR